MIMLINDRKANDTDTLQEDWANPEKVAEMMALMPFEDGNLDVRIVDERGKIQVNALVKFPEADSSSPLSEPCGSDCWNTFSPFLRPSRTVTPI
ncbi:type II secretion system protein GspK [Desulfosarcina cetonica]|uniref:type II secretion system protein GspK n=1 Tax=Desulfosarcina cetonica TaxID=90730 RepID=UPI0006CF5349|nr:type II secretion system protein GspK [Desulfosarcina cetonica]